MRKLLVIIPDKIADLEKKGEIIDRYYNPGNFFNEVHIIATTTGVPKAKTLQRLVGKAKPFFYSIPVTKKLFFLTLGFNKILLKFWVKKFLKIASGVRPNLIRCYGANLNAFAGALIKKNLNIPMLTSLHINPDEDIWKRDKSIKGRILGLTVKKYEKYALKNSDLVLPVYKSIIPYLNKLGIKKFLVCYNMLNKKSIRIKKNYKINKNINLISVGRLIQEKNPINIINAVAKIPNAKLTIVGSGQMEIKIKDIIAKNSLNPKVKLIKSITNDKLCRKLKDFDIFVCHSEYWELSKCILEAFSVGLPVIINKRIGKKVPELNNKNCVLVNNTQKDYHQAILELSKKLKQRQTFGKEAKKTIKKLMTNGNSEKNYVAIYQKFCPS